jgi:D-glycero-D-manno-heptose 1,7-bisphosphate phosphatase
MTYRKALFLDRDGVINYNFGYVYKIMNFKFIEGIFNLVKVAKDKGYLIIIVTNQAGIGRGLYTEEDFLSLMEWVKIKFKENNSDIDDVFFSPFHPLHGIGSYKKDSYLRKPSPGMLLDAQKKHKIDLSESIIIGDNITDIQAGKFAGLKKNILLTERKFYPDAICIKYLSEAIDHL